MSDNPEDAMTLGDLDRMNYREAAKILQRDLLSEQQICATREFELRQVMDRLQQARGVLRDMEMQVEYYARQRNAAVVECATTSSVEKADAMARQAVYDEVETDLRRRVEQLGAIVDPRRVRVRLPRGVSVLETRGADVNEPDLREQDGPSRKSHSVNAGVPRAPSGDKETGAGHVEIADPRLRKAYELLLLSLHRSRQDFKRCEVGGMHFMPIFEEGKAAAYKSAAVSLLVEMDEHQHPLMSGYYEQLVERDVQMIAGESQ